MNLCVCPHCGYDLERFEPRECGDLKLEAHQIHWKGKRVGLRPSGRLIVSALVRAAGIPVSGSALNEAIGAGDDSADPRVLLNTQLCFVRRAFREIDPAFDAIENVWGVGWRWRTEAQ